MVEDTFTRLNVKNIKRVLELQTRCLSNKFWSTNISRPVHETWENLEQCSILLTYHLKTVADYHEFFYDGRLMELDFNRRLAKLMRTGQKMRYIAFNGTLEEVAQITYWLKTQLEDMNRLTVKAKKFMSRARHIRPIYFRVMPILRPMNGVLLCDYRTRDVHLKAGDGVIVVSRPQDRRRSSLSSRRYAVPDPLEGTVVNGQNCSTPSIHEAHHKQPPSAHALTERVHKTSNCMHWDVRNNRDQKVCSVPSICVDLLAPDLDAREKSIALYKVILDTWIDMVDEYTVNICRYFSAVFCGMLKHQVMYTDDPALFEGFLAQVENLLIDLPSETGDYYDEDLAAQLSYLRKSNKGIRPGEQNAEETTTDLSPYEIKQYIDLLHWLEEHRKAIESCIKQFRAFQVVHTKPQATEFTPSRQIELLTLINKFVQNEPRQSADLLKKLKIWNKQFEAEKMANETTEPEKLEESDVENSQVEDDYGDASEEYTETYTPTFLCDDDVSASEGTITLRPLSSNDRKNRRRTM
ncbi:hypothetical protein EG68_07855 [Paragonimus skrjabini miyazakii]|uniref:Uncharacterized protein n=1 Tax=Paragonimus skrjabini miyazakii TaxID=59628 RepID=A0A8S9YRI6_9TREM|nr:hypothetical protein EG68_07855 [Paragonimus skrjabini miyazakii]